MTEFAKSMHFEDTSRRERIRVARVRSVIHAISAQMLHPNPSEHFTAPVAPEAPVAPQGGFDARGEYHYPQEVRNRWGSLGEELPDVAGLDLPVIEKPESAQLRYTTDL